MEDVFDKGSRHERKENQAMTETPRISPTGNGGLAACDQANTRQNLRLLNAIRQIIRAADVDSRKLAAEHQITAPQLMCLMAVVEKGAVTAADIARRIHLSPSTLVGVLDRLEAKGLVRRVRNAADRREVAVMPTDEGRALVAKTPFPLQYSLDRALAQLPEQEQEQMAISMERLADLMGAGSIDPMPMLEIITVHECQNRGERIR
jgi:DNA-binding MarR family transcriptional regulator